MLTPRSVSDFPINFLFNYHENGKPFYFYIVLAKQNPYNKNVIEDFKLTQKVKIAVHNGNYHADDCMSYAILNYVFPDNELIRTRDEKELAACDFIVDVGGIYDGEKHFDHHQRDFHEFRTEDDQIKYASAGLIWKRFGPDYIKKAYPSISDEQIDKIFHDVDYKLIRYIDANDNGIPLGDDEQPTLSKAVYMFNQSIGYIDPENFRLASSFLATVLHGYVTVSFRYIEAEQIVLQALKENCQNKILTLPKKISFLEVVTNHWELFNDVEVVVYPNSTESGWRIQSMPQDPAHRFSNRCPAPEQWRGLRDLQLEHTVGIDGLTFVHPSGFTGGAKNKEVIMQFAAKWIQESHR